MLEIFWVPDLAAGGPYFLCFFGKFTQGVSIRYIYIGFAARYIRLKLVKKHINTSAHHFLFIHTGSPFSILTGFFRITGGDGEGLEGGGVAGGGWRGGVGSSISSTASVLRQDSCLLASKRGEVEMFIEPSGHCLSCSGVA